MPTCKSLFTSVSLALYVYVCVPLCLYVVACMRALLCTHVAVDGVPLPDGNDRYDVQETGKGLSNKEPTELTNSVVIPRF